jgi:mercuric reductase
VTEVARGDDGVIVRVRDGSVTGEIRAAQLLVATGRAPNTENLGLDAAGIKPDARGFIPTDEWMRTANPDVYAAGDVTGGPGYVYVAAYQGGIAAQAALAEIVGTQPIAADLSTTRRVVFTDPQVAAVGLTEQQARAAGLKPKVTTLPVTHLPRAAVSHRRHGVIKLVADADTDRLLGAHVVAPHAGDTIGEAVLAVRFGLRVQELVSTLHPYLTWTEGWKLAGQTFTKDIAKLSCCA